MQTLKKVFISLEGMGVLPRKNQNNVPGHRHDDASIICWLTCKHALYSHSYCICIVCMFIFNMYKPYLEYCHNQNMNLNQKVLYM